MRQHLLSAWALLVCAGSVAAPEPADPPMEGAGLLWKSDVPDGKACLLSQSAVADDPEPRPCVKPANGGGFEIQPCDEDFDHANLSWITADQVDLARVTPSPKTINNIKAFEFFAGHDASGNPRWTHDFAAIKPLIEWNNHMGCVTATYVPGLKRHLMCVTDPCT